VTRRWLPALALLCAAAASDGGRPDRMARLPGTMLWAWEHPQDLRAIDPRTTGVAYLALTLRLSGERITLVPRHQPLRVPAGTRLVAVARLESNGEPPSTAAIPGLTRDLCALVRPGVAAIQLDYDAPRSARPFYRALVTRARRALPDSIGLSITALASWCVDDPWLRDLPVDEIVPMTFRMGRDDEVVRRALAARGDFACAECRRAIGLVTDERAPRLNGARRVYWFQPGPWTPAALAAARQP
jgi:hypothetical protein